MAIGGGTDDAKFCVLKSSGEVRDAGATGKCLAQEVAFTVSDEAFESQTGRTLTINGVAFKKGSNRSITINGVPFAKPRRLRGITINGTAFKPSGGNVITINGTAFKPSGGNTITINGNTFQRGGGGTLTINGTAFRTGTLPSGPAGPQGPAGPAGAVAAGPAPVSFDGPIEAGNGATAKLTSVAYTGSEPRRLLLTGGFDTVCNPCGAPLTPGWELRLDGASQALVSRRMSVIGDGQTAGARSARSSSRRASAGRAPTPSRSSSRRGPGAPTRTRSWRAPSASAS